ncbi:LYR motif-containing protein 7 [Harpegnathos saltator]|uniref:LYR motif-containing protein 7 n=1 Tax=Harpegnathos saltator TaxID=610380 RepID=E2B568_HARSA|nr:LYR motif-containing protein 7 [Harpegnathos saltator]
MTFYLHQVNSYVRGLFLISNVLLFPVVVRNKINEEYRKYKSVTNKAAIEELNKFAQEVEHEVRTTVIQVVETTPGRVELRLTPDVLLDNVPYKDQEDNNLSKEKKPSRLTSKRSKDTK